MPAQRRNLVAACLFFAVTAPFGVATHLISELVGLGWHNDAGLAFSMRHLYLAVVILAALSTLSMVLCRLPAGLRRRRVVELVGALPFNGKGAAFIGLSFAAQLGFSAVTQMSEGRPLCAEDASLGAIAAAVAALIGALIVTFGSQRFFEFAVALWWYEADHQGVRAGVKVTPRDRIIVCSGRRSPVSFRNRPPPIAA